MSDFTDDDVTAVAEILATCYDSRPALSEDAEWILRTVAPAIAARALREAADGIGSGVKSPELDHIPAIYTSEVSDWVRARAEAVSGDE